MKFLLDDILPYGLEKTLHILSIGVIGLYMQDALLFGVAFIIVILYGVIVLPLIVPLKKVMKNKWKIMPSLLLT